MRFSKFEDECTTPGCWRRRLRHDERTEGPGYSDYCLMCSLKRKKPLLRQSAEGYLAVHHPNLPSPEPVAQGDAGTLARCSHVLALAWDLLHHQGKKPTAELMTELLACEGIAMRDIPMSFWDEVTAFRHLTTSNRIKLCQRFINIVSKDSNE